MSKFKKAEQWLAERAKAIAVPVSGMSAIGLVELARQFGLHITTAEATAIVMAAGTIAVHQVRNRPPSGGS